MKNLFLLLLTILLLTNCEKEQAAPVENDPNLQTLVEFRGDAAAIALIDDLTAKVAQMMADGDIGNGPGQSILSKLANIKKKLEQGKTNVAQSKLTELTTHLEELAADGTVDEGIIEELIADAESISCETAPSDQDGDGSFCDDDCDDGNPDIYPGNTEICDNGADDDCDGDIDEADSDCLTCSTDELLYVSVSTSSENYTLLVHPSDNSAGIQYGGHGIFLNAGDYEDGPGNTQTIVNALGNNGGTPYAARLCDDLIAFGCDDWYLPAKNELNAMFAQLGPGGSAHITSGAYWSSTETGATGLSAFTQNFFNGHENAHPKDYAGDGCRCVRKVSCETTPFDIDGDGSFCDVDCDDSNPATHPGAVEICDNGADDDCDGDIDEADSDCPGCATDDLLPVLVNTGTESYTLYVHPTVNSAGIQWGGHGIFLNAGDYEDGPGNTQTIVNALGNNGGAPYAARLCDDLVAFGCDDWYLPAKSELNAMFAQLGPGGSAHITSGAYWSSTETNATGLSAWTQNFFNGNENAHPKDYAGDGCLCVRR